MLDPHKAEVRANKNHPNCSTAVYRDSVCKFFS